MARKKLKPIGKLVDDCATLLQKLVRLKASDHNGYCQCVSCGVTKHWKEMQGGHFIPRGNSTTKLMEENIHPQCMGCNAFGMKYGDAEKQYTLWMIDHYGRDFVDELLATKGKTHKWVRADVEALKVGFSDQIKSMLFDKP
jgi:hypothetical protein